MLGLVPVSSESIRHPNEEGVALDLQRLGWLEPGSNYLFGQLPAGLIKEAGPDVRRGQRHF